jgi:hypothetical protein
MVWRDKHHILGSVLLIAEALGRQGEELADRLAWNTVIDLGIANVPHLRKVLGELRVVHSAFSIAADNRLIHAAIVLLLRIASFAQLVIDLSSSPFSWMLDRHVQEMGFVCDYASLLLESHSSPSLSVHALYANETWVRAMLFVVDPQQHHGHPTHAQLVALHKNLNDNVLSCSNLWLKRQLQRMAAGVKVAVTIAESHSESATHSIRHSIVATLAKDRALAVQAYAKKNGPEAAMAFDDPLFDLREQLRVPEITKSRSAAAAAGQGDNGVAAAEVVETTAGGEPYSLFSSKGPAQSE